MEKPTVQDDILFAQLKKAKRRKRRKALVTTLVVLLLLGVGITGVVTVLRKQVNEQFSEKTAEVLSHQASRGRISTNVSGSGTLGYTDHEEITVPAGVTVESVEIAAGETLAEGDTIAIVDVNSVLTALSDIQTELDSLDKQINSAKSDNVKTYLTAAINGRVKRIYAQPNDSVVDVMAEHGALALLSLDGMMTVTIDAQLTPGDKVTVVSGDKTYPGTVEACRAGKSTISLTDNGPVYQAEAEIQDSEGKALGSGTLEIRSPLAVTGYAGTISYVNVSENSQIWAGGSLFTLKDTAYTANYDALLRSRSETEKTMQELIGLLNNGCLKAPFSGIVTELPQLTGSTAAQTVAVMAPNQQMCISVSVDETDILSLESGQTAEITIRSLGEETYPGTVTEISRVGTSSSGVTQYTAVVTLDRQEKMLSGMSASVEIQIQGADDVLLIPADALHRTRNMSYVFTGYDEATQQYTGMTEVVTGASNSRYVEIISGLNPGDTVYYTEKQTNSFSFMMPGMTGSSGMNFGSTSGSSGNRGNRGSSMPGGMPSGMTGKPGMGG